MDYKPHVVLSGERWDTIAVIEYGDPKYTPSIQMANPEIPLNSALEAGVVLRIPILDVVDTKKELLPPWKQ